MKPLYGSRVPMILEIPSNVIFTFLPRGVSSIQLPHTRPSLLHSHRRGDELKPHLHISS